MTYIVLIMIAYFGPNAQHLGNIQLEIWHFEKSIKDIYLYAKKVSLLLAVDFLSFIINGILLAYFSGINLLKVRITAGFLDCICHWRRVCFNGGTLVLESVDTPTVVDSVLRGCQDFQVQMYICKGLIFHQKFFYFTITYLLSRYLPYYQLEVDMTQHWNWIGYMGNMPWMQPILIDFVVNWMGCSRCT